MSGELAPKKIGRGCQRNLDAGPFQPMIGSFDLHLRAEKKSPKTIRTYLEAAQWFAAEYLLPAGLDDWSDVKARHVQEWTVTLLGRYSDAYANNQFRALQQFFKWHATEDPDEPRSNPVANLKPPKIGDKLVPVFTEDELVALLVTCKGGGFQNRRDIWASSMVMLDSARRGGRAPMLARWLLGLGIAATLAANVAHGLGNGPIGAAVAAWPAVALVGSYELLMMLIRGTLQPAGYVPPETEAAPAGVPDALQAQAAEEFAGDVTAGRMPSIRAIRVRLHVGQPRAYLVRAYLATLATG